jgi:alpha-galactosidase
MDALDKLLVRFHFLGEFINDGKQLHYIGGSEAVSEIERDKVSLPELIGHLKDHCKVEEGSLLHWLFPGKQLNNGLRVLVDDKTCQFMSDSITEGGVADVFVEHIQEGGGGAKSKDKSTSDYEAEIDDEVEETDGTDDGIEVLGSRNVVNIESSPTVQVIGEQKGDTGWSSPYEKDLASKRKFYGSGSGQTSSRGNTTCSKKLPLSVKGIEFDEDSSDDSDYLPGVPAGAGDGRRQR